MAAVAAAGPGDYTAPRPTLFCVVKPATAGGLGASDHLRVICISLARGAPVYADEALGAAPRAGRRCVPLSDALGVKAAMAAPCACEEAPGSLAVGANVHQDDSRKGSSIGQLVGGDESQRAP
jgi:hypothetical protein